MTNSYPSGSPGVPDSMATGAPGFMPRRASSYASVVSGTAATISQPYQQPARSGAFSHLLNQGSDFSYDTTYQNFNANSRYDTRGYDMDYNTTGGGHGRSASWSRGAQLPSFSSAFGSVMNGYAYGSLGSMALADTFFVPSYLKGSKYVQKLEEAHRAKLAALKDGQSAPASQTGSLSTSASSVNLHAKMAPSHRGMTYDLIEKAPPVDDETLAPLPTKMNNQDKQVGLEVLADGQEVKFTGPKPDRERDHEACAIRADHPMPPQCGIYYFEVTIISRKREESSIGIGFSGPKVPLARLPGWEPDSWAYHGDDGHSFCCQTSGKHYGPPFSAGDTIGCGVDFRTGSAFFTKNGDHLGTAFRDIKGKLYPSVGMKRAGEHVRMNFGQSPFIFDIDGMMSASNISSSHSSPSNNPFTGEEPPTTLFLDSSPSMPTLVPTSPPSTTLNGSFFRSQSLSIATLLSSFGSPQGSQVNTSASWNRVSSPRISPVVASHHPLNGSSRPLQTSNIQATTSGRSASINGTVLTVTGVQILPPHDTNVGDGFNLHSEPSDSSRVLNPQTTLSSFDTPLLVSQQLDEAVPLMTIPSLIHQAEPYSDNSLEVIQETLRSATVPDRSATDQAQSYDIFMAAWRTAGQQELESAQINRSSRRAIRTIAPRRSLVPLELSRGQGSQQRAVSGVSTREVELTPRPNTFPVAPEPDPDREPELFPDEPTTVRLEGRLEPAETRAHTDTGQLGIREIPSDLELVTNWLIYQRNCRFRNIATLTDCEVQREKNQIRTEIETMSTDKLAPPLNETELIQSLVLQFLTHDGYVETARAFAEEIHSEKKALSLDPNAVIAGYDLKEDEDAGHRQKIRASILEGDIERALKYTNAYYPHVLKDNEHVYFRLKCRRFVEMIRQGAELHNSNSTNGTKKSNGHSGDWYDDIINHDMDIDDHHPPNNVWDKMDTEEAPGNQMEYQRLLQDTLTYGQDLQAEFKDDPRREVSKALEDAFALMAYEDPLNAKEVAHLLDPSGRVAVAEELNSAILQSLGKSSSAALEQLYQQTTVLLEDLREGGGPGAFVNIDDFARPPSGL